MINPSAFGWVEKFFLEQDFKNQEPILNVTEFYEKTRSTGFLVGYTTNFVTTIAIDTKNWSNQELSKVALLNTLFGVYQLSKKNKNHENFIENCLTFYQTIHGKTKGFLDKILPKDTAAGSLEKIITTRIQTNDNIVSKNFSHILTNSLLFIDVLAFKIYLEEGKISEKYMKRIEEIIVKIVSLALNIKVTKSKYDDLLQKLFESSVRYSKFNKSEIENLEDMDLSFLTNDYEKYYLLDIAGMAMWSDAKLDSKEEDFLYNLALKLNIPKLFVEKSNKEMSQFLSVNKNEIPYFNFSNPIKHFYDQTTQNVQTLITRNKARLLLEITQSKELMLLLAQSTKRELNTDEKKKVRNQILDICKTIPSLTIFIIPGGSLLLPILIKFIPQLLPSAFNENLRE